MKKLSDWLDKGHGYYTYPVAAKVCYEIFTTNYNSSIHGFNEESAIGSLCIFGIWRERDNSWTTEREWLAHNKPIKELLEIAWDDNEKNNK